MNCTKCNSPVEEGALYCKACGHQFAVEEQKAKVNEALANTKTLIAKKLKSPIFLVVAILFSVMFVGQVSSMLTGGIWGILGGILPFIFMLIATIGLWKCYATKDVATASKSLLQASIYDAYTRVMHTIAIVLLSILAVLSFILALVGGAGMGELLAPEGDDASAGAMGAGIVAAIVILVVFAIMITIISIFKGIYAKRRAYFKALASTVETGNYTAVKAPVVGSYVLGGFDVLSAIFPIVLALSGGALINALFGDLLADMGEVGDMVNGLLATMLGSLAISGISSLVSGGYMILSAVWMANVHKAQVENKAVVTAECARLEELDAATKEAMFAEERQRRAAVDAEKAAAAQEAKKAQEQQQQMMQMMMMQMMQGMMPNNTGAPAEAPAETPAEAPVEAPAEAPVEAPAEAPVEAPVEEAAEEPAEAPAEEAKDEATETV